MKLTYYGDMCFRTQDVMFYFCKMRVQRSHALALGERSALKLRPYVGPGRTDDRVWAVLERGIIAAGEPFRTPLVCSTHSRSSKYC